MGGGVRVRARENVDGCDTHTQVEVMTTTMISSIIVADNKLMLAKSAD